MIKDNMTPETTFENTFETTFENTPENINLFPVVFAENIYRLSELEAFGKLMVDTEKKDYFKVSVYSAERRLELDKLNNFTHTFDYFKIIESIELSPERFKNFTNNFSLGLGCYLHERKERKERELIKNNTTPETLKSEIEQLKNEAIGYPVPKENYYLWNLIEFKCKYEEGNLYSSKFENLRIYLNMGVLFGGDYPRLVGMRLKERESLKERA